MGLVNICGVGEMGVGEMGVGKMGQIIGEMEIGEMGVGKMGKKPMKYLPFRDNTSTK